MNPVNPARFDAIARAVHAQSLENLSPQVQARLAQRRRPARAPTARVWAPALAASLVAVALLMPRIQAPAPAARPAVAAMPRPADAVPAADEVLTEDPELYLWLASRDAVSLAME